MSPPLLLPADLTQLSAHGLSEIEVMRQLRLFQGHRPTVQLTRPCKLGDGIEALPEERQEELAKRGEETARAGRITKFVPASGAASRMFKGLTQDDATEGLRRLTAELERFPFAEALDEACSEAGDSLEELIARGDEETLLAHLLGESGLGYARLPKGLLPFHRYEGGVRTPFEEHLVEAIPYVRDGQGVCRLHFTVSGDHQGLFEAELDRLREGVEGDHETRLEVAFSQQDPATDTIAVDLENRPCRHEDGTLVLRPGGHGALIGNLERLGADVAVIKNIDNLVRDRTKPLVVHWKKVLVGRLAELQERIFELVEGLDNESASLATVEAARELAIDELQLLDPARLFGLDRDQTQAFLRDRLDRPLRVCGVVPVSGEPGGGPFWASAGDEISRQIVEASQVARGQGELVSSGTHFNPVDLACGLRDWRGEPFELARFVDHSAVFITTRPGEGGELRALERPGLWNGAMAHWNTLFVEVPGATFEPVKTVFDLLRPAHQPS